MVESRWLRLDRTGRRRPRRGRAGRVRRRSGPVTRPWAPRAVRGRPDATASRPADARPRVVAGERGAAWFRLDPVARRRRRPGRPAPVARPGRRTGGHGRWTCPPSRSPPGRSAGLVLVGADDGSASPARALDVAGGCAWPIADERDVIRRATIDPAGTSIYEMRVDRATRADLGVWRRPLDGRRGRPRGSSPPSRADGRFGRTWSTEFTLGRWRATGSPSSRAARSPAGRASSTRDGGPRSRCSTRPDLGRARRASTATGS